jgi:hypothetical protein
MMLLAMIESRNSVTQKISFRRKHFRSSAVLLSDTKRVKIVSANQRGEDCKEMRGQIVGEKI